MAQWFYGENGQQSGPVEDAEFAALVASQRISPATMVWRDGMPGWVPFGQVQAGGGFFPQPVPQTIGMMNPTTSGMAIASLIFGICGLVSCMVFLGIPAVVLGHMSMHQITNSPVPMVGRGMALAGLVCGYLACLMMLVFCGMIIFPLVFHP